MNVDEKQRIMDLKCRFFDLIDTEGSIVNYEEFTNEMLHSVKTLVGAREVTLFSCNEWENQILLEASTNESLHFNKLAPSSICKNLKDSFVKEEFLKNSFVRMGFERYDRIIHIQNDKRTLGFLALKDIDKPAYDEEFVECVAQECANFLHKAKTLCTVVFEEKRYKQLFRVTEKFHSTMDMDVVLGEIIYTLKEVYPTFTYYLLMSHDNDNHGDLPIIDLEYNTENVTAMQAYLTGILQLEDSIQDRRSILYAPLKGKQGVYGVLQVIAPNTMNFPKSEVEFISLLANTAGSALENAQLYQQSQRLIKDLQLINETSHRLNSNLRLTETINFMTKQIKSSFSGEEVGFALVSDDLHQMKVLNGSTDFFFTAGAQIYLQHIFAKIKVDRDAVFIGDLHMQETEHKYKSVMAVPMVQSGMIKGFVLVLHQQSYQFSFETFKLLQSLIHHSTLAFTNSMLREELEKMVITDQLTKLNSRNYLNEKIITSMNEDAYGAYLLVDVDDFKGINDTYGHQIGDEVLVQVASILQDNIRDTDVAARWGGEELAVYLPRIHHEVALQIANRLVRMVSELTKPAVTISCGISFWEKEKNDNFQRLFKRADIALYKAKETGKNKVVVQEYTEAID